MNEFIKILIVFIWIVIGIIIFYDEIMGSDKNHDSKENHDEKQLKNESKTTVIKTETVIKEKTVVVEPSPKAKVEEKVVVAQVKEDEVEEEVDEAELENVQIFKTEINERKGFYESLTKEEQLEFDSYFVNPGEKHLAKELNYVKGANNSDFFMRVFNFIYRYRKIISYSLLEKLSDELQSFTSGDPNIQTLLYELAIRTAYFRRKDIKFYEISEKWSRADVKIHQTILNSTNKYVYSYTRLAIILEKNKQLKEALDLVNDAMRRNLTDKTRTGYNGRKERLLKKVGNLA